MDDIVIELVKIQQDRLKRRHYWLTNPVDRARYCGEIVDRFDRSDLFILRWFQVHRLVLATCSEAYHDEMRR